MGAAVTDGRLKPVRNHIDFATLVAVLALMLFSLGVVYSASSTRAYLSSLNSEETLVGHFERVALSIVVMFIVMRVDYHRYMKLSKLLLVASIGLLFLTLAIGLVSHGASRWLWGIQPSEFAKYALLFHLCVLMTVKGDAIRDFRRGFIPMMVWIGIVCALVVLQPNYSTAMMIVLLSLILVFIGGARLKHLGLVMAPAAPVLIGVLFLEAYRIKRIRDYVNALFGDLDRNSLSHQLYQSLIAFGRGGIFGVGPGESTQREFYLPEAHTDFIYSIIGEEYGFVGAMFFLLLFLMILYRGYRIARYAPDPLGRNLAIAVTSTITLYALVNAGVALGILPTTGLPMPFVSFGGSSMLFTGAAVGVLLNISSQTDLHPRAAQVPVVGSVNAGKAAVGKVY